MRLEGNKAKKKCKTETVLKWKSSGVQRATGKRERRAQSTGDLVN